MILLFLSSFFFCVSFCEVFWLATFDVRDVQQWNNRARDSLPAFVRSSALQHIWGAYSMTQSASQMDVLLMQYNSFEDWSNHMEEMDEFMRESVERLAVNWQSKFYERLDSFLVEKRAQDAGGFYSAVTYVVRDNMETQFSAEISRYSPELKTVNGLLEVHILDNPHGKDFLLLLEFDSYPSVGRWLDSRLSKEAVRSVESLCDSFTVDTWIPHPRVPPGGIIGGGGYSHGEL